MSVVVSLEFSGTGIGAGPAVVSYRSYFTSLIGY